MGWLGPGVLAIWVLGFRFGVFFFGEIKGGGYFFVGQEVVLGFWGVEVFFCRGVGFVGVLVQREGLVAAFGLGFLNWILFWFKRGCDRRAPVSLVFRLFFALRLFVVKLVPIDEPRVLVCNPFLAIFHFSLPFFTINKSGTVQNLNQSAKFKFKFANP